MLGMATAVFVSMQRPTTSAANSGIRTNDTEPVPVDPPPAREPVTQPRHEDRTTEVNALSQVSAGAPGPSTRQVAEQRALALEQLAELPAPANPQEPAGRRDTAVAGAAGAVAQPSPAMPQTTYASDADGVGHAITDSMPAIRDCYDRYWGHGQEPPSNVRVHLVVAPSAGDPSRSTVAVAETVAGALQNGAVEDCLKSRLSTLSFQGLRAPLDTNLPLVFSAAETTAQQ